MVLKETVVFRLNTTVFAEEVAVDSVEDAVEAAVDEVAEEATVDAVVDATGTVDTTYYYSHALFDEEKGLQAEITYAADPNDKKDKTEKVVTIKNVDNCVSWANMYKGANGYTYDNPVADQYTDGGDDLIYTVLKGTSEDDENLVNDKKVTVSNNNGGTSEAEQKFYHKLRVSQFAHYEVLDLGDNSHYLFVGYGDNDKCVIEDVQGYEGLLPVFEYDGRQINFNKSGDYKATKSKNERLDVAAALVKYENGTLTEIPGVTVTGIKLAKKTGKDATVSGQTISEKWKYTDIDPDDATKTKELEGVRAVYPTLASATLPTFKLSVKVAGEAKDQKKAITAALKDKDFAFAIRQKIVDTEVADEDIIFHDAESNDYSDHVNEVSSNSVFENANVLFASTGNWDEVWFSDDDFTISKFDQAKSKANLVMNVSVGKAGDYKNATISLKAGTDYDFSDGTVGTESVKVLDFKGNFVYRDTRTPVVGEGQLSTLGYKYAFRQAPTEDGKKSKKFREGIFKENSNGFVYSVDETAVDSVEEAF